MLILRSINHGYRTGSLSITQKQGIITCIPKPNKSRHYLKNWRPISLLNVVYKLASTVIANRLKTILDKVINEDQKGFISGRFIGENIRLIYDILYETKNQDIPGLLLSIDFQQAFDSISWKFVSKTLDYFNFGPSFKSWIKLFQNGTESCILQNGFLSEYFYLQRGCRQGDPISPYIFILCAEVLSNMIRKEKSIKGININNILYNLSQYADDTQIFLDGSEASLRATLEILDKFYKMSGLKINKDKTKALWIGSRINSTEILCREHNLDWEQGPIKILGVTFSPEVFNIWDINSQDTLTKIEKIIKTWSPRKLTLPGRITVIKSLALSKFTHLFISLPNPPDELLKRLDKIFYKFLWNSGPDRISRNNMIRNEREGGLRMIQIRTFIKALKVTWFRRLLINPKNIIWSSLSNIEFAKLFSLGDGYALHITQELRNPFWVDILHSWKEFINCQKAESLSDILYSPVWFNSELQGGQNLFYKNWYDKGIRSILDIINVQGEFYNFADFKNAYGIRGTFLNFQAIINRIPNDWKNIINNNKEICREFKYNIVQANPINILLRDKKGSRRIYDIFFKNIRHDVQIRWSRDLGIIQREDWININSTIKEFSEVKLKDFQFKINNKILVTKSFLHRINLIDNNTCSLCTEYPETIKHLFFECEKVKQFWNLFKEWLNDVTNIEVDINNEKMLILSWHKKNSLLNYLLVVAKYYIYKSKFVQGSISILGFKAILKKKFEEEKYIAKINDKYTKFLGKWSSLYTVLNNM